MSQDVGDAAETGRSDHVSGPPGWVIQATAGAAQWFHDQDPGDDPDHQVWVHHVSTQAVVLGSTQEHRLVRSDVAERRGVEVCRRRSGGGLVHIQPESDLWIDVVIPRPSKLWDDDVGRSFHWLGRHWARVLDRHYAGRGVSLDWVVVDSPVRRPEGRLLCFADIGHGEVLCGDRKVVGLSQRRTRRWARLQGLLVPRGRHHTLLPLLDATCASEVLDRARAKLRPHHRTGHDETDDGSYGLRERRAAAVLRSVDNTVGMPEGGPRPDRDRLIEEFCRSLPAL